MRASFKGKISKILREEEGGAGNVQIQLDLKGKVDTKAVNAKDASLALSLSLKPLIADEIKIGSTITVWLTDEDPERSLLD